MSDSRAKSCATTLHSLVRGGSRAVKFGRRTLFRAETIRAFIEISESRLRIAELKGGR